MKVEYVARDTSEYYSPHDQLPAPLPKDSVYAVDHFYHNTAKFLIKDTVRIMSNGLNIDMDKVIELEAKLDEIIKQVQEKLDNNVIVQKYIEGKHKELTRSYKAQQLLKLKKPENFVKPFKHNDKVHRSYFMYVYAQKQGISQPKELLPTGIPVWSANTVKKLAASNKLLQKLLDKTLSVTNTIVVEAMNLLATHKCEMYNKAYLANIANPNVPIPSFNPASSQQKKELFQMLGISSETTSKTSGEESFSRTEIERINKETQDEVIKEITQCLIDHSFAAIVRNNFIEAFYTYTVDGRLYGTYKLLGFNI